MNATTSPAERSSLDTAPQLSIARTILWWELRRIPFNLVLLVIGAVSGWTLIVAMDKYVSASQDPFNPLAMFFGAGFYAVGANIFYTLGWIVELIVRRFDAAVARQSARVMFVWGFVASCILTSAPLWIAAFVWLSSLVKKP
jgi:hypothetical protein